MKISVTLKLVAAIAIIAGASMFYSSGSPKQPSPVANLETDSNAIQLVASESGGEFHLGGDVNLSDRSVRQADFDSSFDVIDDQIALCQGYADCGQCGSNAGCGCGGGGNAAGWPTKAVCGVDGNSGGFREPLWANRQAVPWEAFAYGEYLGPHRTPHVPEYRLRVNDQLEFVYLRTRELSHQAYQIYVGDTISISSAIDSSLNQTEVTVLSDGKLSLKLIGQVRAAGKTIEALQNELNDKYTKYVKNPAVVVQVLKSDTPLLDLLVSVDATAGQGGQVRQATVSPDGTVQLPLIGSVPAVGLTLDEIRREVNARYRIRLRGIEVTPVLIERAPRFVFVLGEVGEAGRFELTGPTTVLQALALAQSFNAEGNVRQVIVFRRDQNWRLTATKLDLAGALYGRRPHPADEIWLRDSDIVLVPKKPITRISEAVDQYFTRTLYSLFPAELGSFDAGQVLN